MGLHPCLRLSAALWQLAQILAGNPESAKDLIPPGVSLNQRGTRVIG